MGTKFNNWITAALANALHYPSAGGLREAEGIYQRILKADRHNADALHLLGVLNHQKGKVRLAVAYIRRAITACSSNAIFTPTLGMR
jgi:Tfp pilus assembly protein PilF